VGGRSGRRRSPRFPQLRAQRVPLRWWLWGTRDRRRRTGWSRCRSARPRGTAARAAAAVAARGPL